jgi:hypothetical protein
MTKLFVALLLVVSCSAFSADLPVKLGGFIDAYYAYDFNAPSNFEREYTTQPVRHNEFNVNLAYLDATVQRDTTRARLAIQYGHSVTKNTIFEPKLGPTSGADQAKMIQEAFVGKKISSNTWVDAGIFFGNIGAESWISKDNWTYSRALNLDYVPYYSAGVRLQHQLSNQESVQIQILNGWQNMSENNGAKALGMQYKNILSPTLNFTYNNFLGDEAVVPDPKTNQFKPRFRAYHNFIARWDFSERYQFLAAFDIGHQAQQENHGVDGWTATTLTIRRVLDAKNSLALRTEYYSDPHQTNVSTRTPNGFQILGASLNYDQKLDEFTLWRTEIRGFHSKDRIYPQGSKYKNNLDGFIVTSLSTWF